MLWVDIMITLFNFTLNYVDISLIVIFLVSSLLGYFKGFAITLINFFRYTIGMFLCFYLSSNLTPIIYDGFVKQMALDSINKNLEANGVDAFISDFTQTVEGLPSFLTSSVDLSVLSINSENIANVILLNIVEPILLTAIKIIVFVIVFLVFFIATGLIIRIAQKIAKRKEEKRGHKTMLKRTDMLLGGALGIIKALVIVLAITSVMMYVLSLNSGDNAVFMQLQESKVLQMLNSINPFNAITEGLI